jgi:outer membrane protein assembly factor BamB
MYRSDSSRSGVGTGYMGFAPTVLWKSNITWELVQTKIDFEGHTWTTPAVVNGVVYICSTSHVAINFRNHLWWSDAYALNATNGAEIWDYRINSSEQMSAPAVVNGVVYFGSDDNKVYALSASNGALFWNSTIVNGGLSSPAVVDGVVYIGGYDGNVYALNAANGDIIWNSTAGINVGWSSPAVVGGVVYIGSGDDNFYALNAKNGNQLWNCNTNGWAMYSPAVANGVVYASSSDGNVYALNAATGVKLWNFSTFAIVGESPPAVAKGLVYFDSYDGNVYALNAAFGTKVWSFTDGKGTGSSPVVVDGIVISARPSGTYALNAENGAVIWNYSNFNVTFGSDPVVDNGVLYFGSGDGQVYALGVPSASYPSLGPTASPVQTSNEFSNQLIIITAVMSVAIVLSAVFILKKKKFGNRTLG